MSQTALTFYLLHGQRVSHLPLGSARGCQQTLSPLYAPSMHRTLDGRLISSEPVPDKYQSVIVCTDKIPPALEGIVPGTKLRVECLQHIVTPLVEAGEGKTLQLTRTPVPGSVIFLQDDKETSLSVHAHKEVSLANCIGVGHVVYRPILDMMVVKLVVKTVEWDASTVWEMSLHEL